MNDYESLIQTLQQTNDLCDSELIALISMPEKEPAEKKLFQAADSIRKQNYGIDVYIRGLIEFTNYCKNNCFYCGIRRDNINCTRYRLSKQDILSCCKEGYALGFRTFVLQGGEDSFFSDNKICSIITSIKNSFPDCAVTLSIGEKSYDSYKAYFDAGANRYLLRHETADPTHYSSLHPKELSLEKRKQCLFYLKKIGYQVGSGFMVGSPGQTPDHLVRDLRFLQELKPDMIGIGPYLVHKDTPFSDKKNGSMTLTLRMIAILRLLFPYALLPSTTALGTIHPKGREYGLRAGANVLMPNLSPTNVRHLYTLYDHKAYNGDESAQQRKHLELIVQKAGYRIVTSRGDVKNH